jgi:hypothetical protein
MAFNRTHAGERHHFVSILTQFFELFAIAISIDYSTDSFIIHFFASFVLRVPLSLHAVDAESTVAAKSKFMSRLCNTPREPNAMRLS